MKTSMKTSICIGLVILAVVGIAGCAGSNEQKSEIAQPAAEATTPVSEPTGAASNVPAQPVVAPETVIATFSGDDSTTTKQFTVPAKWKIEWEVQDDADSSYKSFTVYLYNDKGESLDLVASESGPDKGETYMYKEGTYALDISSTLPYNITVKTA